MKIEDFPYLQEILQSGENLVLEKQELSQEALLLAFCAKSTKRPLLVITEPLQKEQLAEELGFFLGRDVHLLPSWETLPSENIPPSPDIVGERLETLLAIHEDKYPAVVVTSLQGAMQSVLPLSYLEKNMLSLKIKQKISLTKLVKHLQSVGYQRRPTVIDKGEYAVRGGIVDLFPVTTKAPIRVEFWDEEIESMRFFDPIAQKSVEKTESCRIFPAGELAMLKEHSQSLSSLLGEETFIAMDHLSSLEDKWVELKSLEGKKNLDLQCVGDFFSSIDPYQKVFFSLNGLERLTEVMVSQKEQVYVQGARPHHVSFSLFSSDFSAKRWLPDLLSVKEFCLRKGLGDEEGSLLEVIKDGELSLEDITFFFASSKEKRSLEKLLESEGFPLEKCVLEESPLSKGMVNIDPFRLFLPYAELVHHNPVRRKKVRSSFHSDPVDLWNLEKGDLLVHNQHGIGKFLGMETRPNAEGTPTEYLSLSYAEGGKLFVPVTQSYLISKYIGTQDLGTSAPALHTLGSSRWKRLRDRTQKAIQDYAKKLLEVQAKREIEGGFACPEDSSEMEIFEEEFPYQETEDQLRAIEEIKKDMQSLRSMDRLICGDVGFGKTEVAMRAAFRAVVEGKKQVAVLVPTTILALQHYETFSARMKDYPIRVALLSRMRSTKEVKQTLKELAEGSVDIVVGTHKLVGKGVVFKDLGLVVVDEEHRFGVKVKEHLKAIKVGVDYLAMSATPIPRTLQLSLMGTRDISLINTPPHDRLPIKTVVKEYEEEGVRQAILRELTRQGQVFFIHNRIDSQFRVVEKIKEWVPHARVLTAHGQMSSQELDQTFHALKEGRIDILVATSLVENGVDIPNANTLIIERADRFGLADLYQLRGRVGRWNRRAFAYFLTPKNQVISEDARRRLRALQEAGGFGGGMKVAMRDLEIRGAGDILGVEQSGHISQIGFHLYCKMLKRTVESLKGTSGHSFVETKMEFPQDARIPEYYVEEMALRMELYQRVGEACHLEEIEELFKEIEDRFGKLPIEALWLQLLSRLRVVAGQLGITLLRLEKLSLYVEFQRKDKIEKCRYLLKPMRSPEELETIVLAVLQRFKNGDLGKEIKRVR